MTSTCNLEEQLESVLGALEIKETQLLAWGIVDGGFTRDEVVELAESTLIANGFYDDPEDVVRCLRERCLLIELNIGGRRLYRTRMAEAVRLFSRLRQVFPSRNWRSAPTLVADFRLNIQPRHFPSQDLEISKVEEYLEDNTRLTGLRRDVLREIITGREASPLKLSWFQLSATRCLLNQVDSGVSKGMIVCAGTGSGKTLAFFLPSLMYLSELVDRGSHWTKAIAIYPRNELLKDQLSELYKEARRLDDLLIKRAGRKMTIGAFFGPTPKYGTKEDLDNRREWVRCPGGYICTYMRCPRCERPLVWSDEDLDNGAERLRCEHIGCGAVVEQDEVLLTRQRMAKSPPDILLTSTEMLNRQLSDGRYGHVFGVGSVHHPKIMLLDETHTYSAIHGAQVAFLLRRWRHAVRGPVQFTGLSATLQDASSFFSELTGINTASVEEVRPAENVDLIGMEYHLLLRGDPVSRGSLLSTSIQAAMLLGRVLDPEERAPSQGAYGTRVFAFVDDLDVSNRLYHDLLDAEGCDSWGNQEKDPLAMLRSQDQDENAERLRWGQSWQMCEIIGHNLEDPMRVGRTTSQDTGVGEGLNVVVATSTLELGFNDPTVGAVMQHKAPHSMASFLQRKGRAGRKRKMRPWTVVVLSDYGRDRIAYQAYERLFNPEFEKRNLPIDNRYVQRMQAVFSLMEWVSRKINGRYPGGTMWNDFAAPGKGRYRERQFREAKLVRAVLGGGEMLEEFADHLCGALKLEREDIDVLLWEPPRPLMTEVLPTILRRLESGWRKVPVGPDDGDMDYHQWSKPLPGFVPENLFSDLNLPEVTMLTPPQQRGDDPGFHQMPIVQALQTYAPGSVSRRFGISHAFVRHWIEPPSLEDTDQDIQVESFCEDYEELGHVQLCEDGNATEMRCLRPWTFHLRIPQRSVKTSSWASLNWRTQIAPHLSGLQLKPPAGSPWRDLVCEVIFYSHNRDSSVEVRRFAASSDASIRILGQDDREATIRFTSGMDREPVTIGFTQEVDGIAFRVRVPKSLCMGAEDPNQRKIRSFRTALFRHLLESDEHIVSAANKFQRDWLAQVYLSALTARAIIDRTSLLKANHSLLNGDTGTELTDVLASIFQALALETEAEPSESDEQEQAEGEGGRQSLHQALHELFCEPGIYSALGRLAAVLWDGEDESWKDWARQRYKATLGEVLLEACHQIHPRCEPGDLYLDLDPGPRPAELPPIPEGLEEIWITETTTGGNGSVEEVLRRFASDPRRFFRLAESVLTPSDFEVVDSELTAVLVLTESDQDVRSALSDVRKAGGHADLEDAYGRLRDVLSSRGVLTSHPVMSAISTRIIRPGSSEKTDQFLRDLAGFWLAEEERLGIEITSRVIAYVASKNDLIGGALDQLEHIPPEDPYWRFQAIYGLLWPRGNVIRSTELKSYNPFARIPDSDRGILLDVLRTGQETVNVSEEQWRERISVALTRDGVVQLQAHAKDLEKLKAAVLSIASEPVEVGYMYLYPKIEGVERDKQTVLVTLYLEEAVQ